MKYAGGMVESVVGEIAKCFIDEMADLGFDDPDFEIAVRRRGPDGLDAIQKVESMASDFLEIRPILVEAAFASFKLTSTGNEDDDIVLAAKVMVQRAKGCAIEMWRERSSV